MPEQDQQPRISLKEKERRWSLLRDRLEQADLAGIIVYGGSQLGVPVHYLTNVWGTRMSLLALLRSRATCNAARPSGADETGLANRRGQFRVVPDLFYFTVLKPKLPTRKSIVSCLQISTV